MAIEIREHVPGRDLEDFLRAGRVVFDGDPSWVPPLDFDIRGRLTPGKSPFFERGELALFTAWRDGRLVGRISAQIDHEHLKLYSELTLSRWAAYQRTLSGESRDSTVDAALNARVTNESLRRWLFSLDALLSVPRTSFSLSPQATWNVKSYLSVSFGALWVKSYSPESLLDSFGQTSQVFVLLRYLFTMG